MKVYHSVVLTALIPEAKNDLWLFAAAAERAAEAGADTIEFYTEPQNARRWGNVLKELGMRGVYLAAYIQKQMGYDLSSTDPATAAKAVEIGKASIDAGMEAGAWRVLLSGGRYPEHSGEEALAWDALREALCSLAEYAKGGISLSLEPGDRSVDAMQLAGPTADTVNMIEQIAARYPIALTMDVSHMAQLAEQPEEAIRRAAPFCDHVHIANCVLKKDSSLYGDKHPFFDEPDGVYTRQRLQQLADFSLRVLPHSELTVAAEVISKGGMSEVDRLLKDEAWLFGV